MSGFFVCRYARNEFGRHQNFSEQAIILPIMISTLTNSTWIEIFYRIGPLAALLGAVQQPAFIRSEGSLPTGPMEMIAMIRSARLFLGCIFAILLTPIAANAAEDPFLGTWHLNKAISTIAKDPGVKSKVFVFSPTAEGVLISETLEMLSEAGKQQHSQIPYTYGKPVKQAGPGIDTLFVVKADDRTAYWTGLEKGQIVAQLQVNLSSDGTKMIFRYLWAAADPSGLVVKDRYVYERQ